MPTPTTGRFSPAASLRAIRTGHPLIHQITNYVVMNETANITLAIGASPVMAHALAEVEEIDVYKRQAAASAPGSPAETESTPRISAASPISAATSAALPRTMATATSARIRREASVRILVAPAPTGSRTTGAP